MAQIRTLSVGVVECIFSDRNVEFLMCGTFKVVQRQGVVLFYCRALWERDFETRPVFSVFL